MKNSKNMTLEYKNTSSRDMKEGVREKNSIEEIRRRYNEDYK